MIRKYNLDYLVCRHTPLYTFDDLVDHTGKTYNPPLQCLSASNEQDRKEMKTIADKFDTIMMVRGEQRRAKRF